MILHAISPFPYSTTTRMPACELANLAISTMLVVHANLGRWLIER